MIVTVLHSSLYCTMISVHFSIRTVPIATIISTVRYEIYLAVFGVGSAAIMWLVWLRFHRLGKIVR